MGRGNFDSSKLEEVLKRAGASGKSVELILRDISDLMVDGMTTHEIYSRAFEMPHVWRGRWRFPLIEARNHGSCCSVCFEKFV